VDLSPEMLAQSRARNARRRVSERLTLRQGGLEQVEGSVDLVVAVHVLLLLAQPSKRWPRCAPPSPPAAWSRSGYRCRQDIPRRPAGLPSRGACAL